MNNSAKEEPIVYSVKKVGQLLHTNVSFIYDLIYLGLLPAIKLGSLRVRKESLEKFLRDHDGLDLSDPKNIKPLVALP